MGWAVAVFAVLTALCIGVWVVSAANVRQAEDNWNVVFAMLGSGFFGFVTLVLLIIWLALK